MNQRMNERRLFQPASCSCCFLKRTLWFLGLCPQTSQEDVRVSVPAGDSAGLGTQDGHSTRVSVL